ncbi:MAG TPA: hypothetical protein VMV79_06520 [Alphaproteobacteria bacterium]|nr:hypothetical protein [Alphaproteobacteria bacterium]
MPGEITVLTAIYGSPKKSNGISYLNKRNLGMDEGGRDQAINWLTQRQYVMPYFELLRLTPAGQSWIEDYLARNASPASAGQMARQPSFPEPNFSVC